MYGRAAANISITTFTHASRRGLQIFRRSAAGRRYRSVSTPEACVPMMKLRLSVLLLLPMAILLLGVISIAAQTPGRSRAFSLAGLWRFELDPTDAGIRQEWYKRDFRGRIRLPGILQSQDYGLPISTNTPWVLSLYDHYWYLREDYKAYIEPGKVKVPFLSQPPRHYLGAAWYQRDLQIYQNTSGRRVVLTLERPHWSTTVWVDDRMVGSQMSLVAPVHDLGRVTAGVSSDNSRGQPDAHAVPARA